MTKGGLLFFTWLGSVAVANIMHSHFVTVNWRPTLVVVKFCGTTQSWFDCKCCRQKLCATWVVNCTYISSTSIVQYKKYCMQLIKVCVSYHVCNCMPSNNCLQVKSQLCAAVFDKSCVRMHVKLCVWLHVCICVHLCVCVRAHVCVHLSQIIIHKEETKLNFTILFTNERPNLQITCLCVKKVQTKH